MSEYYSGSGDFKLELEFDFERITEGELTVFDSNYLLKTVAENSGSHSVHTMIIVGKYGYSGCRGRGGNDDETCHTLETEIKEVVLKTYDDDRVKLVFSGEVAQAIGDLPFIEGEIERKIEEKECSDFCLGYVRVLDESEEEPPDDEYRSDGDYEIIQK